MDHIKADRTLASERYLLGEMSAPEREEFEEHIFVCSECAETVRTGAVFADNARAVFREWDARARSAGVEARNLGIIPWWKRFMLPVLMPACAVLALVCLAGYQRVVVISRLRNQLALATAPQPLPAFALHDVSRGEQPVIVLPKQARYFSVYFDVAIQSTAGYLCQIRDASGSVRFAISAPQPKPGEPVNLLLESSALPAGDYTLVVRTETPDAREVGQHPFRVEYK